MAKRRKATEPSNKDVYDGVIQRANAIKNGLASALARELRRRDGIVELERDIANSSGFKILERRKLAALISDAPENEEAKDSRSRAVAGLTFKELAALDAFWREDGGVFRKVQRATLADIASHADVVHAFVPSRHWDQQEALGYVPVADVRAAATIRRTVLGLNPTLRLYLEEVPKEDRDLKAMIHSRGTDPLEATFLKERLGHRHEDVAVISIGAPRSNRLTKHLLESFFGTSCPFSIDVEEDKRRRYVTVDGKQHPDHAVICYRRLARERRLEIIIAGDSSESTMGAARCLGDIEDSGTGNGVVIWALAHATRGTGSEPGTWKILDHYPKQFSPNE